MTNKKLGNDFESQLCEILSDEGFWTHNFAQNQAGQPADIVAVRNGKAYLIDCKVCSNGSFALSRIEDNQDLAMKHWETCGNGMGWFAILLGNSAIYMMSHSLMRTLSSRQSIVSEPEICQRGLHLVDWLSLA